VRNEALLEPEQVRDGSCAGGQVGGEPTDQRGELGTVAGAGGEDGDPVRPVQDEVFRGGIGKQAGGLGVRIRNQARQVLCDVINDPTTGDLRLPSEKYLLEALTNQRYG
jgi:hypothetical protein